MIATSRIVEAPWKMGNADMKRVASVLVKKAQMMMQCSSCQLPKTEVARVFTVRTLTHTLIVYSGVNITHIYFAFTSF